MCFAETLPCEQSVDKRRAQTSHCRRAQTSHYRLVPMSSSLGNKEKSQSRQAQICQEFLIFKAEQTRFGLLNFSLCCRNAVRGKLDAPDQSDNTSWRESALCAKAFRRGVTTKILKKYPDSWRPSLLGSFCLKVKTALLRLSLPLRHPL